MRHFRPYYWLFNYTSINEFSSWQASSVLSDPAQRHKVGLTAKYFSDVSKSAYDFSYTYQLKHFSIGASSGKDYSRNSISRDIQQRDYAQVQTGLSYKNWGGSAYYLQTNTNDFVSARDFQRIGLWQKVQHKKKWRRSFLQKFSFGFGGYYQKTKNRENFFGKQAVTKFNFNLLKRLQLSLKGTYGKLTNDSLRSGVLYGGANNETLFGGQRIHDFYGLNFGDLFGREIWTSRAQFQFLLSNYYSGWGLFPWFIKKIHFLAGLDFAKSDFSFIGTQIFRNKKITSYHAGIGLDSQLFYLMPAQINLIATNVHHGQVKDDWQLLFLFSTPITVL